jgi:O-antigen ligase
MIYLLMIVPMFSFVPFIFNCTSATPKILSIFVGLYLAYQPGIRKTAEVQAPALIFLAACMLSWITAQNHWAGFYGYHQAPYYGLVGVAVIIASYLAGAGIEEDFGNILIWAGALLGVFAVVQYISGMSFLGINLQDGRASGFRGSPVMFASGLIPCGLLAWNRMSWNSEILFDRDVIKDRCLFALIVLGIAAAQSKGAAMSLVLGIWVYETRGWERWAGVATWMAILWLYMLNVHTTTNLERLELLRISWVSFLQRPLLGWGPDNFLYALVANKTPEYSRLVGSSLQASAHQDIAQVAVTLGVIGIAAYGYLMYSLVRSSYSRIAISLLVAMWFQAQVNPIPVDILVLVAVILGYHHESEDYIIPQSWWAQAILAVGVFIVTSDISNRAWNIIK